MADEVQGSVSGGNGERLQLTLGSKSFGLQSKDLIPILLLIMMGGGGYLLYTNVMHHVQGLHQGQLTLQEGLHENRELVLRSVQDWRSLMDGQMNYVRKLLQTHDYNNGREPHDKLPLDMPPPGKER